MAPYETDTVDTAELDDNAEYFERLYLLDQVGELRPEQMLEDEVVGDHVEHADQAAYDLERLEESLDDLPEEYGETFREIDGIAAQLDDVREIDVSREDRNPLSPAEAREQIEEYVDESTATDEELGYEVDDISRLFYAKHWENGLKQRHGIDGVLDSTYVLDVLE
jgi:hypothetical protein